MKSALRIRMRGTSKDRNKRIIEKEVTSYSGQLVIYSGEIYMLQGYVDNKDDYYYELKDMFGKQFCCSCVLDIIPLKKYLPRKHYREVEDLWHLNEVKVRNKTI